MTWGRLRGTCHALEGRALHSPQRCCVLGSPESATEKWGPAAPGEQVSRGLPKSVAGRCLLVASPSLCLEAGAVLPGQGSRPQHRWVFPGPHGPSEPGTAEQPEGGGPVPPVFSCLPPSTPLQRRANRVYLPGEHRSIPGVQHRRGDDAALGFRAGPCLRRVPSTAQRPGSSGTWSVPVSHTGDEFPAPESSPKHCGLRLGWKLPEQLCGMGTGRPWGPGTEQEEVGASRGWLGS